jgi:hypothetical protein
LFEYKKQIKITDFQKEFEVFLSQYTILNFDMELSVANLPSLIEKEGKDERNWYAIYLYPLLGRDYLRFYLENGYKDYLYTALDIIGGMEGHILFNSYLVDDVVKGLKRYEQFCCGGVKRFELPHVQDIVYGTRRLLWSFITRYAQKHSLNL